MADTALDGVIDAIAAGAADLTTWRRDIHAHPETAFAEHRTAEVVADRLQAFGVEGWWWWWWCGCGYCW